MVEESETQKSGSIRLSDYQGPAFTTDSVRLFVDIFSDHTIVRSRVRYYRTEAGAGSNELIIYAQNPNPIQSDGSAKGGTKGGNGKDSVEYGRRQYIRQILLDGKECPDYIFDERQDILHLPVQTGENSIDVEIVTYLEPQFNSALSGLYKSDRCFVTQCESEGFRRITPFLDRPDVMAVYDVTITAPVSLCPVLISNGNRTEENYLPGDGDDRRIMARFYDPWPKPSYLFAMACGQFDSIEDFYTTQSGRKVRLKIYTDTNSAEKGWHAMNALKLSMKWDEETFDCEYDLDDYGVVAVAKFSMGAMENKGLNVFRDSLVLASPETATDDDYQNIIDVIGHEYFHNFSGNRITLANWFNLSLKEGLTVNREQLFTAFTTSEALERISSVQFLRKGQFPEDDSPAAHPVMPPEIHAVDNIYSPTVYLKGSEVIRMMKTIMGEETFIRAVKKYFQKYDGQAVTIEEFISSMETESGCDFSTQFKLWYTQSGRPSVKAAGLYDPRSKTYRLSLEQHCEPTRDQAEKKSMFIPLLTALIDEQGNIPFRLAGEEKREETVLHFTKMKQSYIFEEVEREPMFHSLLRGFSAPIDLEPGLTEDQLYLQMLNDSDGFNRWDAGQKLALQQLKNLYAAFLENRPPEMDQKFIDNFRRMLGDRTTDPNLTAMALTMPAVSELEAMLRPVQPAAIAGALSFMRKSLSRELYSEWKAVFEYARENCESYQFEYRQVGLRRMKGLALFYLTEAGQKTDLQLARNIYFSADNMTDCMAAMTALADHMGPEREEIFADFYQRFQHDALTIQKYFRLRAMSRFDGILEDLENLIESPEFIWENPGHVQNVFRGFVANYEYFHRNDGSGYTFLAQAVKKMVRINGTIASGLVVPLCRFRDYKNHEAMQHALESIRDDINLALQSGSLRKDHTAAVMDRIEKAL